ncbi:DUF1826 domain-containing protein [Catenovulum sp. SM1970]|uniref:DUF1826 domain-containing protein n=1 Tax=Marinifaba aquimaris TaxID=2741323 RepID=UPI0015728E1F|nr:DUF1826 domain-containing protein [Marinifaba aquimaris]NTS78196.1 DUF1826 domain-containing protein [Marinifaba aquimaris]
MQLAPFQPVDEAFLNKPGLVRTTSTSTDAAVLADIYQEDNNLAIWQRDIDETFSNEIKTFIEQAPSFKLSETLTAANAQITMRSKLKGYVGAERLSADIADLVDMFTCLFELEKVGLRLTVLDKAMCPRFHVDRVPCRLITTYFGANSQWLAHEHVDRTKLGAGNRGRCDEASGLYQSAEHIQSMSTGDVSLLKGELWAGNESAGLVHRSPALKDGEKRLLLTLDFVG